ncbi:D-isomer specific 2-hydroxyacid dehydrogenase family protein [Nocardia wallacei]|uniref:Lactate dehydrogenase n=1 Tax=Nocardia wallacei TaxID=480035 RepID=A0A7G1KNK1_9NOCA|nr:D-isomer specific 2-hydroxyacid dehydrogenase family protein [Nocardia wallacei]BCK56797.1 lactate dehydrogenase [Nocardia wallacei]
MSSSEPAISRSRPPATAGPSVRATIYGCGADEAVLFRQLAPRFGVLPTLTAAPVAEDTVDLALGNRAVSVGHRTRVTNATLAALSRAGVQYISTRSVGYDHIDVEYAHRVGISVGTVTYSPDSVADFTVMSMLMLVRGVKSVLRRSALHDYRPSDTRGRELRDLTVGVVGTGRIGRAVIDRLRGFGCRVLTYDIRPTVHVGRAGLDELLVNSDIVTLHTPLSTTTHHLLDRQRIDRMKYGAFVVNTGRGSLIDTSGLLSALESGRLGGAALDVLEGEEGIFYADCRNEHIDNAALLRLQRLPNVLISPHIAYYTDHALADIVENSLIDLVNFEMDTAAHE